MVMFKTNFICGETTTKSYNECNPVVLLMIQKLNNTCPDTTKLLYRITCFHLPQVILRFTFSLYIEEEIYIT